jgi:hypothetical protein
MPVARIIVENCGPRMDRMKWTNYHGTPGSPWMSNLTPVGLFPDGVWRVITPRETDEYVPWTPEIQDEVNRDCADRGSMSG